MYLQLREICNEIDPRIQLYLDCRARGLVPPATSSTERGEIAVIAKVSDLTSWLNQSEVFPGANLGATPDGAYIVTAKVPLNRVQRLRQLPYVQSLKATQSLKPTLNATTEEIKAQTKLIIPSSEGQQGKGVVIGIIVWAVILPIVTFAILMVGLEFLRFGIRRLKIPLQALLDTVRFTLKLKSMLLCAHLTPILP